jgi:hypothetical protein
MEPKVILPKPALMNCGHWSYVVSQFRGKETYWILSEKLSMHLCTGVLDATTACKMKNVSNIDKMPYRNPIPHLEVIEEERFQFILYHFPVPLCVL